MVQEIMEEKEKWDLDGILTELKFGPYQVKTFILLGLLMIYSNLFPLSFSLTAADLQYRCLIPECENLESAKLQFMPLWIRDAVPFRDRWEPWKCKRFKPLVNITTNNNSSCSVSFSSTEEEICNEWVFETDEVTIVNEFGILCENHRWRLSMVGTINNVGQFLGILLFGIISDWFGRKSIAIICTILSTIFGISRGFSTTYSMFTMFEFLDSFFGAAIYGTVFIMAIELVNPKHRSLAMLVQVFYPIGAVYMGCIGWYFQNWRKLLIFSYSPGLLFISYFWLIPESVRWLHMKGRDAEAHDILKKIVKSNDVEIPEKVFEDYTKSVMTNSNIQKKHLLWKSIVTAFQTKHIFLRLLNCSWAWFAATLVYYGISINSVELVGNKYMNFILTSLVEIPGMLFVVVFLDRIKRRLFQSSAFFLSGLACIASEYIPAEILVLKMGFFLMSKLLISISFALLFVYSAEMFPTDLRLSLNGISSTMGRIGSMIAPQITLFRLVLGNHAAGLIFGIIAISAGGLATTFPETSNKKLHDTIDQSKADIDL